MPSLRITWIGKSSEALSTEGKVRVFRVFVEVRERIIRVFVEVWRAIRAGRSWG